MKRSDLDAIRDACRRRQSIAVVTELTTGAQRLAEADRDRSTVVGDGDAESFVHIFRPAPRLIVVGAVHIAQKLVPFARLADFEVSLVDPRAGFASPERFPGITPIRDWPDRAVAALSPDAATAVVVLSHDPKLDDPALAEALRSPAFYIGALGSRRSHAKRLDRLRGEGFDEPALARIRGPVGFPIGAVTPGEIAVSIVAEIVAALHARTLRDVSG